MQQVASNRAITKHDFVNITLLSVKTPPGDVEIVSGLGTGTAPPSPCSNVIGLAYVSAVSGFGTGT